jgi:hypothetical protein
VTAALPPAHSPARPTVAWVRLGLAPALVFIVACLDRGYQTEVWQHLARGRLIAETREVVSVDRFTFTVPGRPMRDNNWLSQVLYYKLFSAGGIELLQVVNALALAAATAVAVGLCRRASGSSKLAAAGGVLLFLGMWQTFLIRPQSFSLLLFVLLLGVLEASRRDRRWLVLPPLMMALWANLHGGFAIGLLLIGAFTAGTGLEWLATLTRKHRRIATEAARDPWDDVRATPDDRRGFYAVLSISACLGFSILATLLNPYGLDVYRYAADLSKLGLERGIEEWLPPGPDLWVSRAFYASVLLLVAAILASKRRLGYADACIIFCFLPPALIAVRMVPWWLLATMPILVRLAGGVRVRPARPAERPTFGAAAALGALAVVVVVSTPWLDRINPVMGTIRPATRAEASVGDVAGRLLANRGVDRRVFARFEWGNYLCWAGGAQNQVFMEGHVELYPDALWEEYLTISAGGAGWSRALDRYGVDTLLLEDAYHRQLIRRVRESSAWVEIARSGNALAFERRPGTGFADGQEELQRGAADGR